MRVLFFGVFFDIIPRVAEKREEISAAVCAFAEEVLGAERGTLCLGSAYGEAPNWDSVMHLRLVMEFEERFGVRLPFEEIPKMGTLKDFADFLERSAQKEEPE